MQPRLARLAPSRRGDGEGADAADATHAAAAPTQAPSLPSQRATQYGARDDEETRRLRQQIRAVKTRAMADREELIDPTTHRLEDELNVLNALQQQVTRPREQAEEADAFDLIAQRGLESAQLLAAGGKNRTARQFTRILKAALTTACQADPTAGIEAARAAGRPDLPLEPGDLDWRLLAAKEASMARPAVGATAILGALTAVPRARAARAAGARGEPGPRLGDGTADGPATSPGGGGGDGAGDEPAQETDRRMEALYADLAAPSRGGQAVGVLEAALDHGSFATTVENLFALSFLVRDGRVALEDEPAGRGVVARALPPRPRGAREPDAAGRRQLVLAFTARDWAAWCAAVPAEACLMPRHAELTGGGGGGGGGAARPRQRRRVG